MVAGVCDNNLELLRANFLPDDCRSILDGGDEDDDVSSLEDDFTSLDIIYQ